MHHPDICDIMCLLSIQWLMNEWKRAFGVVFVQLVGCLLPFLHPVLKWCDHAFHKSTGGKGTEERDSRRVTAMWEAILLAIKPYRCCSLCVKFVCIVCWNNVEMLNVGLTIYWILHCNNNTQEIKCRISGSTLSLSLCICISLSKTSLSVSYLTWCKATSNPDKCPWMEHH